MVRRIENLLVSPWRFALAPGWLVYRPLVALRNLAYDFGWRPMFTLPVPVVSVGNLAAGGTGKTPFCAWLCQRLEQAGWKSAVLMRGYGGDGGPNDEARLLQAPVVCDPDRVRGGQQAIAAGATCLVLDDGFQHRRLRRQLDIVLIDALRPWGGGAVLPLGLLREGRSALKRASCLVLTRSDQVDEATRDALVCTLMRWNVPVICARHQPIVLRDLDGDNQREPVMLSGTPVVLASGIGNPQGFERTARDLGWTIAAHLQFPDHHAYSDADCATLRAAAQQHQATLVVTAKDAVKLRNRGLIGAQVLEIALGFAPPDEERLWARIAASLASPPATPPG